MGHQSRVWLGFLKGDFSTSEGSPAPSKHFIHWDIRMATWRHLGNGFCLKFSRKDLVIVHSREWLLWASLRPLVEDKNSSPGIWEARLCWRSTRELPVATRVWLGGGCCCLNGQHRENFIPVSIQIMPCLKSVQGGHQFCTAALYCFPPLKYLSDLVLFVFKAIPWLTLYLLPWDRWVNLAPSKAWSFCIIKIVLLTCLVTQDSFWDAPSHSVFPHVSQSPCKRFMITPLTSN